MLDNQGFFERARHQILEFQRRRAIKRRDHKRAEGEIRREIELFLDDAVTQGFDLKNDRDLAIVMRAAMLKSGEHQHDEDDGMTDDHRDMDF
jgi:hypothetical protein